FICRDLVRRGGSACLRRAVGGGIGMSAGRWTQGAGGGLAPGGRTCGGKGQRCPGVTKHCWIKCVWKCCRRCRNKGPWWLGSWTTPAFPRKVSIRSESRQYCGQVGKQENCRIAVSLSVATWDSSLPIAYRLYLPKNWSEDAERREKAEVPEEVEFQTKPEI